MFCKVQQARLAMWESLEKNIWSEGRGRDRNDKNRPQRGEYIVKVMNTQKLRRMEHMKRMVESKISKTIMARTVWENRRRGRPSWRWRIEVQKDIRNVRLTRWKEVAKNRNRWRKIRRSVDIHILICIYQHFYLTSTVRNCSWHSKTYERKYMEYQIYCAQICNNEYCNQKNVISKFMNLTA